MRNRLVALVVCLGVFSHFQSMAQTNRHFPFNTVGDAYGKIGAPDKPCGVGRADANPKLLLNDT